MRYLILIFALLITTVASAQSFSDYEQYVRKESKKHKMTVETKYSPGDFVFIIVGSGDTAKVYESPISSVNINVAMSGTEVTYICGIDRTKIGTHVAGMPTMTYTEKKDKNMYDTAEECFNAIVILNEQNKKKNGHNNN